MRTSCALAARPCRLGGGERIGADLRCTTDGHAAAVGQTKLEGSLMNSNLQFECCAVPAPRPPFAKPQANPNTFAMPVYPPARRHLRRAIASLTERPSRAAKIQLLRFRQTARSYSGAAAQRFGQSFRSSSIFNCVSNLHRRPSHDCDSRRRCGRGGLIHTTMPMVTQRVWPPPGVTSASTGSAPNAGWRAAIPVGCRRCSPRMRARPSSRSDANAGFGRSNSFVARPVSKNSVINLRLDRLQILFKVL